MAATIEELFGSRMQVSGDNPGAEFLYAVFNCASEEGAIALTQSTAPATYNSLSRRTVEITERINSTTWRISVKYGNPPEGETFYPGSSFDTTGGTQHITQSVATMARYGPKASTQLGGAIGFDGENVNGCDIIVPVGNWSETRYLDDAHCNRGLYLALTGSVNGDIFQSFAPGEVLFMGASGQKNWKLNLWEVTFKFGFSPNRSGLQIGSISGIAKDGWDYLWVQYGETVDSAAMTRIKRPVAVYIEQVYPRANLSALPV